MQLNVLGPLELRVDGASVALGAPKQRAVLALLTMHADRVVSADAIVDALWGDTPPGNPLGGLQAYVSHLRRLLEPDRAGRPPRVLVSAADGYGLMTIGVRLDVREVEARLQSARDREARGFPADAVVEYDAALALWRGNAYADVRNDEWAQTEIARIEELRLTASDERAAALLAAGRADEVVTAMEAVTRAHPLRERSWELLASGYAHASRQGDALAALRRVREILAAELGLDPSPRLRRLEEAVLRQQLVAVAPPTSPASASSPAPAISGGATRHPRPRPFVGRAEELRVLHEAAASSADGLVILLLDGEPGVGKTCLVERFTADLACPTLWGRCPDHETAPALWPWEQVLGQLAAGRPDLCVPETVRTLLSGRGAAAPAYVVQGARFRLLDDVTRHVAAAAPVCVVLEDLHAADQASLALLVHLAESKTPGLLVLATFRRHEASTLTATLGRLSREGARRLTLDGLDTEGVRALVTASSGTDPGELAAASLRERTAGNPFFVTELVRADSAVPEGIRDVVQARVASLGGPTRAILEAAAVVGDEAQAWLVAEVAGRSLAETVEGLDVAEAAGLVQRAGQGLGIRFTHALVVDALIEGRSGAWRAAASERCAVALTRAHGDLEEQHGAIARHWLAASALGPEQARSAAEFCARAARSAMTRYAPEDSITFWQEAAAAGTLGHLRPDELFEHRLGLAEALHAAGRYADGYDAVVAALAVARDDPARAVRAADTCMAHGVWVPFPHGTDPTAVRTALDKALGVLPTGSASWALGQACRSVILAATGGEADIDRVSRQAVAAAQRLGDAALLSRTLHLRLIAMRGPDFVEQRASTAREIRGLPDLPQPLLVIADLHLASYLVERGRVEEARALLADVDDRSAATHDPTLARQVLSMQVGLMLLEGRYPEALSALDSVGAATTTVDAAFFQAAEVGQRLLVALERGELSGLVPLLEGLVEQTGIAGFSYCLGLALLARGAPGDPDRAREVLVGTPLPPRDWTWVGAVMPRLQLALAVGAREVLVECRELMLPFSGQLMVSGTTTAVYGAYDGHLGEVALALADRETAGRELTAAVALLERNGAGYWLERARQALAQCT